MSDKRRFPWLRPGNPTFYLYWLASVAIVGIAAVAIAERAAVAIVAGLAAHVVGGLMGFIFGIPRYAASDTQRMLDDEQGRDIVKYRANTNLEQISDWLTKIIVGLGLTQFRSIGDRFSSTVKDLGSALTGSVSTYATTIAASLVLLNLIVGFVYFYLWSRVYLPRMFQVAERRAD